jgi:hypothetical protein
MIGSKPKPKRADAEYLAKMCQELANMARQNGLHVGSYLLNMAREEFTTQQRQPNKSVAGGQPRSSAIVHAGSPLSLKVRR